MTETTPIGPDSATPPAAEEKPKLLLMLLDNWAARTKHMGYKRENVEYKKAMREFWLGAAVAAEFLGQPLSPIVAIYLLSGRDMLELRDKVDA